MTAQGATQDLRTQLTQLTSTSHHRRRRHHHDDDDYYHHHHHYHCHYPTLPSQKVNRVNWVQPGQLGQPGQHIYRPPAPTHFLEFID